jgi:hypothetical protein
MILISVCATVAYGDAAALRVEADGLVITGSGWTVQPLANGKAAFSNRPYVWAELPEPGEGWRYTQTAGGVPAEVTVEARKDSTLYLATAPSQAGLDAAGWKPLDGVSFRYSDGGRTALQVFARAVKAGEKVELPQGNWAGGLLLLGATFPDVLARLPVNNPGATADLGVGLWAWPLPMDYDGDGDLDLVVACPDKPYNGTYFFENPTGTTAKRKGLFGLGGPGSMPVFKPGRRIGKGLTNVQVSEADGRALVMSPGMIYPDFKATGFEKGVKLEGVASNVHSNGVRGNVWRAADYDGDGVRDLVVGVGDWKPYGWDDGYDAAGRWTRDPLHGLVYWVRNTGTTAQPVYAKPEPVCAAGKPVDVYGNPMPMFEDWDGDGDLDLLCGEFIDGFTYFENTGTRQAPVYAAGRSVRARGGRRLAMELEMITPTAVDWDGDGDLDLICGDEDGRVAFIENTGKLGADRVPSFLTPRYFRQEAADLKFGALVTPWACDWDGDGDDDLICGNTAGYVGFIENLSGKGVAQPRWAEPVRLEAGGETVRIMAGPNGSIQGPCEAKWGYTTVSVADWDGDGLLDVLANSIWGKVVWYRNAGTRAAAKLEAARPVEVEWEGAQPALDWGWVKPEGKALLTQWRTTPVTIDWDRDGLVDLVMLDQEGYLAFFKRSVRDGKRVLLPPTRVFCDEKGAPLQFNAKRAGHSGRRKLCMADWDGDGKRDIIINAKSAEFWRQVGEKDGTWLFRNMGAVSPTVLAGHTTSPTVTDFDGDGIPDLLIGAEDGHVYTLRNPRARPSGPSEAGIGH